MYVCCVDSACLSDVSYVQLHGHSFQVVEMDGQVLPRGAVRDTVMVPAGGCRTATVCFDADNPGVWPLHCHQAYHMAAGMYTTVEYAAALDASVTAPALQERVPFSAFAWPDYSHPCPSVSATPAGSVTLSQMALVMVLISTVAGGAFLAVVAMKVQMVYQGRHPLQRLPALQKSRLGYRPVVHDEDIDHHVDLELHNRNLD